MDKFIDTAFEEVSSAVEESYENSEINGEPLYYNTMQVSKIIEENDSTTRYWSKVFQPILNIKISNKMKRYTKDDIDKLKFIKHLIRVDGLTLKQVVEYCSTKGFDDELGLDTSNPLAVKTFISGLTDEMDKKFIEMQNTIIKQQQEMIDFLKEIIVTNNIELKADISNTVDEVISDKMDGYFEGLKEELAITKEINKNLEEQKHEINNNFNSMSEKLIEEHKKSIEEIKTEFKYIKSEELKNQPKSFLEKIFGKKN